MNKVLVTGAAGFVGDRLVRRLLELDAVAVRAGVHRSLPPEPWPETVEVLPASIDDTAALARAAAGVDTVFHLAGKVHDFDELADSGAHGAVSLAGTKHMFEAALVGGAKRFVFMSSLAVFGPGTTDVRRERDPCDPVTPYGRAKLEAERWLIRQAGRHEMGITCLRPAMVYGRGAKGNLPRMIGMMRRGLFPPLPEVGTKRSMVHVENLIDACLLAAQADETVRQVYIVTDGEDDSKPKL